MKQSVFGISLISMVTLMFELLVNKVLSFSTWGSLGYMIIGSAIFGFSIAGVATAIWQPHKKYQLSMLMGYASFVFSISVLLCYIVMNIVPFNFEDLLSDPLKQIIFFTIWYLMLLIPFSMTGFIVVSLLINFKEQNNRMYAADLIGAGIGCIIVVPLFPLLGAAGQYLVCASIGAICTIIFSYKKLRNLTVVASVLAVILVVVSVFAQSVYPVKTHQKKRGRAEHYAGGFIKYSMWSFLTKIEAAILPEKESGMIWFDGGLMQSAIDRFDGDYWKEKDSERVNGAYSIAYRIKPRKNVLIIAPAGGREVRTALVWGAEKVTGVELDYSVVKLGKRDLNDYLGGIFNDKRVSIVNDEGRSFVRRSKDKYDTIQFISAYSVTAIQSGAIDLASSYLVTEEAFDDYLDHLTYDGVLSVARDLNLRLFTTAWKVLKRRGLEPSERIVLISGASLGRNTLLVKLSPFDNSELEIIKKVCIENKSPINYAPHLLMKEVDDGNSGLVSELKTRKIIEEFVGTHPKKLDNFYSKLKYRAWPVTDNNPFFNSQRYFFQDMAEDPKLLTEELEEYTQKTWYIRYFPIGYAARIVVLTEAIVFAALFLIFPLWRFKSSGVHEQWQRISMLYFLSLGIGFIWIEICVLKIFILFLGSPVYSISVVLFAMLIFAGVGSFFSEKINGKLKRKLSIVGVAIFCSVMLMTFVYPLFFQLCLGFPFYLRVFIALLLIAPVGFILGMPFPIGLKFLSNTKSETIAWAWAMNGYATVVGVATSAMLALQTGFAALLWISFGVYIFGFLCLIGSQRVRDKVIYDII